MHILIIPSEEFVPLRFPIAGIFQYHQARILKDAGHQVGVISVRQSFSIPMVLKALFFKLLGKKVANAADNYSFPGLTTLMCQKIFSPRKFIELERKDGINVIRIDGFYFKGWVENKNHYGWIKAGMAAYEKYFQLYGKPDIIHSHNALYAGMLGKKIRERFGVPYIVTEHSTVFSRQLISDKSTLKRVEKAYQNSASLTAVSHPFCDLLNNTFSTRRFEYLPNVLDPEFETKEFNTERKRFQRFY